MSPLIPTSSVPLSSSNVTSRSNGCLGRDLLADGLKGSAGYADVRIWSAAGRGDQLMYIALGSSAGTALLEVPVMDLMSFLQNTEALVPRGTESGHVDWDVELAHLLPQG
ncbi:SsgA family sporulation/cell division regulator [Streptomyces sp. NPDC002676]